MADDPARGDGGKSSGGFLGMGSSTIVAVIIAAVFGAALGIVLSTSSGDIRNIDSRAAIDRSVPDAEFCADYGASAVVADLRVFLSFNPFSVYVTQPTMQPGCIIRRSNWTILQQRNAISSEQTRECKDRLNTFGFTGSLDSAPRVDCIYQNNSAGNLFSRDGNGFSPDPARDDF